jgi:hypothetical protein
MSSVFNGFLYPLRIIPLNHQKVIFDKNEAQSSGQAFCKIDNLSINKGINWKFNLLYLLMKQNLHSLNRKSMKVRIV